MMDHINKFYIAQLLEMSSIDQNYLDSIYHLYKKALLKSYEISSAYFLAF